MLETKKKISCHASHVQLQDWPGGDRIKQWFGTLEWISREMVAGIPHLLPGMAVDIGVPQPGASGELGRRPRHSIRPRCGFDD
jgi:hypothetical protein